MREQRTLEAQLDSCVLAKRCRAARACSQQQHTGAVPLVDSVTSAVYVFGKVGTPPTEEAVRKRVASMMRGWWVA